MRKVLVWVAGLALMAMALATRPDTADDFRATYLAASLVGTSDGTYSHAIGTTADTYLGYVRFPSYAWMVRPLSLLPYGTARSIWVALLITAFGLLAWRYPGRRERLVTALCWSFPVAFSLVLGQDIALVLLFAFAAAGLHQRGHPWVGGLVASLLFIKATFLLPVGLVYLAKSRKGSIALLAGIAAQTGLCFAVDGASWPAALLGVLRNPLLDAEVRRMLSLRAVASYVPLAGPLYVVTALAVLGWLWFLARRVDFPTAIAIALPLGMISSAHSHVYDAAVLVPLLASVATPRNWTGRLALFGLTPIPYLWIVSNSPLRTFAGAVSVVAVVLVATLTKYRQTLGEPAVRCQRVLNDSGEILSLGSDHVAGIPGM